MPCSSAGIAAEREAAEAAARAGARELMRMWRRLDPGSVHEKSRNDYVSAADRASEGAIRGVLSGRFPDDAWRGEESGDSGEGNRRWIVDPLDGTLNYVQGFPHWCVSVALWDEEGPRAACVLDPLREDVFVAARGRGATWNGAPMRVSPQATLDGAFLATGFAFQMRDRWARFRPALEAAFSRAKGIRRAGSAALDLAHTACGIYDGFFELGLQAWDLAAGVLLLTEAGGCLTDWEGGSGWSTTGDLVAGTPGVQRDLVAAIRSDPTSPVR